MYEYFCVVKRIVDGDTVDVDIDLGFGVWLNNQRIRLKDIDAPEVRTRDLEEKELGFESRDYVESRLPLNTRVVLISDEYDGQKGKYGRIVGDFRIYDPVYDQWSLLTEVMVRDEKAKRKIY